MLKNKVSLGKSLKRKPKDGFCTWTVRNEFQLNQFITLRLIDFGNTDISSIAIYVNDRRFPSLDKLPFKEILEILSESEKINYSCMDEARLDLLGTYDKKKFLEDPDMEFWIYCYYINAWVECNYDWRLLTVVDAFAILHALYRAGDLKAREVFKIEIVKALLSGYPPAIFYLTSSNNCYLNYFEFEEVIWLFEKCLKIVGFHYRSELKTHYFYFLRDKGFQYFDSHSFKNSIKCLKKALKIYPDDIETLQQLGVVYLKNGDYQLARALLIYVIDRFSSDDLSTENYIVKEAWVYLGELYNRLFLFNKAIIACNKAMDLDWNHVNSWDQIAIAYDGMGDFKRAKEAQKSFKKKEKKMNKKLKRWRTRHLLWKIRRIMRFSHYYQKISKRISDHSRYSLQISNNRK
jgi:tetratricopeptide (TPR) repeat protein